MKQRKLFGNCADSLMCRNMTQSLLWVSLMWLTILRVGFWQIWGSVILSSLSERTEETSRQSMFRFPQLYPTQCPSDLVLCQIQLMV